MRLEAQTVVAPRDVFSVCGLAPLAGVPIGRSTIARSMPAVAILGPHTSALDLVDEPIPGPLHGPLAGARPRRLGREGTCRSPT